MVGAGEPLWLAEDRWWALALAEAEADTCRDCGHSLAETTDTAAEDGYDAELTRCHGCVGAAKRVGAFLADGGKSEGLQVRVMGRQR